MPGRILALLPHALLLVLLALPATAQDCPDGDVACDEELYALEEALFMYESGAAAGMIPEAARCLSADTAAWRGGIARACLGVECRMAALRDRLAVLDPLQPGATRLNDREHPQVAEMLAVIAPEKDAAGTPQDFYTTPEVRASGTLAHSGGKGDHEGLALRTDIGTDMVIVFDAEIGTQPAHEVLTGLADKGEGRFMVRGVTADAGDGQPNFDPSRCRFLHRAPE